MTGNETEDLRPPPPARLPDLAMTEAEARRLLGNPGTPCHPRGAMLPPEERAWLLAQAWHRTWHGWQVAGDLRGGRFCIEPEHGPPNGALYVVRGTVSPEGKARTKGIWLERP